MVEPAFQPNTLESGYQRILELGRGGTARVYLAKSTKGLRRLVVLKTLEPELATNAEMRELFRREAEVCARLNHPNIVQVQEVLEEPSGPVIVMEYLEGIALSQAIIRSEGRLSKRLHLHAITQLLAGLQYFHELRDYDRSKALNPIHRDVSPQNVILLYEGAVKVLDFGIAKLSSETQTTKTGIVKGKLHYMPAEQLLSDESIDRRADLFSAGVMLWEALAGRRIWLGHSDNTVMRSLINGKLPDLREVAPDYPSKFYEVVSRAMASSPKDRYSTALELQIDVEHILGSFGGPVNTRELSDFMQSEFAEYRQTRQAAIQAALHQSIPPASTQDSPDSISTKNTRRRASVDRSLSDVITTKPRPRRRAAVAVVLLSLAVAGLAIGAYARKGPAKNARATAPAAQRAQPVSTIHVTVLSEPPGASVLINGRSLGVTPYAGTLPVQKEMATLELRNDGYELVTTSVSLASDLTLTVPLQKVAPSKDVAVAGTEAKLTRKHSKAVAPSAKPATQPAVAEPNCIPPYTLSSDGIRVYKAECFKDNAK